MLALKQTAGRGRRGRKWLSGDSNFTASLLTYPTIPENHFSFLSYVAGIALYESVIELGVSKKELCLKWPNDLLLNGKKIGGILLESVSTLRNDKKALIVGFGLNLVSFPSLNDLDESALPADSLKNGSAVLSKPEDVLDILMTIYNKWNEILSSGGFLNIREAFLERTIKIGQIIQVKKINKASYGIFSGITNSGSLILSTSTGTVFITAGDVFLVGK